MQSILPLAKAVLACSAYYHGRTELKQIRPFLDQFAQQASYFAKLGMTGKLFLPSTKNGVEKFVEAVYPFLKVVANNRNIPLEQIDWFRQGLTSIRTGSDSAVKNAESAAFKVGGDLSVLWATDHDSYDNSAHDKVVRNIVKKLTGEDKPFLTMKDGSNFPEGHKLRPLYLEHNKVNAQGREIWVAAARRVIANNGGKPMPVKDLRDQLKEMGVVRDYLNPSVYKTPLKIGLSSQTGKPALFTKSGLEIDGMPHPEAKVVYNTSYSDEEGGEVFRGESDAFVRGSRSFYTIQQAQKRAGRIKGYVEGIGEKIPKMLVRWIADAKQDGDWNRKVCATCVLAIYMTGGRVGSKWGTPTTGVGISTTRARNWVVKGNTARVRYNGKSGVKQDYTIDGSESPEAKIVVNNIRAFIAGKDGGSPAFSREEDSDVPLESTPVNKYIRSTGWPSGAAIHKMRHFQGTKLAEEIVATKDFKPSRAAKGNLVKSEKEAMEWLKKNVLTPVAKLLGHKKDNKEPNLATAIKSYLEPEFLANWFKSHKLRVPKQIPKFLRD